MKLAMDWMGAWVDCQNVTCIAQLPRAGDIALFSGN